MLLKISIIVIVKISIIKIKGNNLTNITKVRIEIINFKDQEKKFKRENLKIIKENEFIYVCQYKTLYYHLKSIPFVVNFPF